MNQKILAFQTLFLIFFIFFLNHFALRFYWYTSIWWLDMPVHFLGGLWLGLTSVLFLPIKNINTKSILIVLGIVLFIGCGLEVFEIFTNNYLADMSFNTLDTLSDIFFDLTGGTAALLYLFPKML